MNQPANGLDEREVNQNGDLGSYSSVFSCVHSAATLHQGTLSAFQKDTHAQKVYLAGREYLNEDGQTCEPLLVGKLKQQANSDPTLRQEYPSYFGLEEFTRRSIEVALRSCSKALVENRVFGVQTPGFTGAVRLGAELLRHRSDVSSVWNGPVYLSSDCDDLLAGIFQAAGIEDIRQYSYWNEEWHGICFEKLLADLEAAPEQSVVVLSASSHYPTGADLSHSQWTSVAQLMMSRRLFPFLLLPTQGLCFGDLAKDAWPVQYCVSLGMEVLCAQSFAHCFGIYGEAVGHLTCVLKSNLLMLAVQSQAEKIVRSLWVPQSVGGAHIVATILSNPAHLVEWQRDLKHIVKRCMLIREVLRERLRLLGSPGSWDHLTQQNGLFCCLGLNSQQVDFLSNRRHVYMLPGGCLNISAINSRTLDFIAESIHLALTTSL